MTIWGREFLNVIISSFLAEFFLWVKVLNVCVCERESSEYKKEL